MVTAAENRNDPRQPNFAQSLWATWRSTNGLLKGLGITVRTSIAACQAVQGGAQIEQTGAAVLLQGRITQLGR